MRTDQPKYNPNLIGPLLGIVFNRRGVKTAFASRDKQTGKICLRRFNSLDEATLAIQTMPIFRDRAMSNGSSVEIVPSNTRGENMVFPVKGYNLKLIC